MFPLSFYFLCLIPIRSGNHPAWQDSPSAVDRFGDFLFLRRSEFLAGKLFKFIEKPTALPDTKYFWHSSIIPSFFQNKKRETLKA